MNEETSEIINICIKEWPMIKDIYNFWPGWLLGGDYLTVEILID